MGRSPFWTTVFRLRVRNLTAIDEHTRQQVPGPRQLYRLARKHIRAMGAYFRLDPIPA
jgi:hypothetical protein